MYLEGYNLIFIHVPKTAGNSLTRRFVQCWGADPLIKERDRHTFELRDSRTTKKHQSLATYQMLLGEQFSSATVAWVWRDPAERLASWYLSQHRQPRGRVRAMLH